ncbi:unnamed protein product [Blepharisma stoltei]|uniref:Uncharacterized protein n=1 Tax=Blepharisma stoltei TaxID=1481888 RepID=A0AAU9J724_9CILI|nr:unnamed protein product [Blepharisma stoltei]
MRDLSTCNSQWCQNKVSFMCLCDNLENYFCWDHYIGHVSMCNNKNHETMQVEGISSEIYDKIQDKLNVVIEETNKLKEIINEELGKLEDHHEKIQVKVSKTRKTLTIELQAIVDTCNLVIEKMKKPIIKKDYYTQLE